MTCRGKNFRGKWSAPAMYTIGGASAGFQVGGSSTDFVLLIMAPTAVDKVLNSKVKVGSDMTAAAGPGVTSAGSVGGEDILTYGRAKGLFAGMSLSGASLDPDSDANQRLYGKAVSAREIVLDNAVKATPGGQPPGVAAQQQGAEEVGPGSWTARTQSVSAFTFRRKERLSTLIVLEWGALQIPVNPRPTW